MNCTIIIIRKKILLIIVTGILLAVNLSFSVAAKNSIKNKIKEYNITDVISTYTTYFDLNKTNRSHNIKLATNKINGVTILPGDIFSFNQVVGSRNKAAGYKSATEIINGKFVSGIGGGVCQVSSTLYNSVLLANLKVIERKHHSRPVKYIPLGRGATVYYNYIDFKFKNNTNFPIIIMAKVINNQLTISILGQNLNQQIKIITSSLEVIKPKTITKLDKNLLPGAKEVTDKGKKGFEVVIKKIITEGEQIIKQEIVSKDIYSPIPRVVKYNPVN